MNLADQFEEGFDFGSRTAQLISYLKTTGKRLGLLINFDVRVLKDGIKRIAN